MPEARPAAGAKLGDRLEWLFATIKSESGAPHSNREIAEKINSGNPYGVTISSAYIGELRRGVTTDPRVSHARAIAWAFGVDPGYLLEDATSRQVQQEIGLLLELRQMGVTQVALRTVLRESGLSEDNVRLVEDLVHRLREVAPASGERRDSHTKTRRRGSK